MYNCGSPEPFKVEFPDSALDRLQARLTETWLPSDPIVPGGSWSYGTDLTKLKQILRDWTTGSPLKSDGKRAGSASGVKTWWRGVEEHINRYPHYRVKIESVSLHYQVAMSKHEDAIPLIFSHGWPGSFLEADLILDDLTSPPPGHRAFHVIVPSLPGYGLSGGVPKPGWTLFDTARIFDTLMTQVLQFPSYVAQGGDWGSAVTRMLSFYPACKALHVNFAPPNPPLWAKPLLGLAMAGYNIDGLLPYVYDSFETRGLKRAIEYLSEGSGYVSIQQTKPATVGYGLHDSPVAILSYILEKYEIWSDPRAPAFAQPGKAERRSGMNDENILMNITLYYLTGTIHTSFLPYKETKGTVFARLGTDRKLTNPGAHKPFGYSAFPYELAAGPASWLPRLNVNVAFKNRHEYGGHFAALDNPDGLIADLRAFFPSHWRS